MTSQRMRTMFVLGCALLLPAAASAAGFEGVLKFRMINVSDSALSKLAGGETKSPEKVFAIPLDKILAETKTAESGVQEHDSTIYIKGSKLRMEGLSGRNAGGYVIMDLAKNVSFVVMPQDKKYLEWSSADMKAMSSKMAEVRKQMKERLAGLPPEQRKQVEAMMKKMGGGSEEAAPKVTVKPLGQTRTINGMRTTGYEVRAGGETTEAWMTQEHPALLNTFKAMEKNQEQMVPPQQRRTMRARAALAEHGLPVLTQTLGEYGYHIQELLSVQKQSVADAQFSPPAGFKKETGREMMREGMQREHMHGH